MANRDNSNKSGMVLDGLSKQLQLTTNELLASNRTPKPKQEASRSELKARRESATRTDATSARADSKLLKKRRSIESLKKQLHYINFSRQNFDLIS